MSITESRYISVWLPKTLKGTGMVRSNFNFASGLLEVKLWLMKWQICNTLREAGGRIKLDQGHLGMSDPLKLDF